MRIKEYFEKLANEVKLQFDIAQRARAKGLDPEQKVEVILAKNLAERVVGLISNIAPQVKDSGIVERILELEKEYGALDWRVCFVIALEIAQEKFCKFSSKKEAIEVGIRTGFAYSTVGVVSSPLEGFTGLEIKKRNDNKGEYFSLRYAGPIRNAGGTNAALSVLIADYVRKKLNFAPWDPTIEEIKRAITELEDYDERVSRLQYFPTKQETEFFLSNLPVEIAGDPSEKIEVSNYKDLPRVETNKIRSGYCLVIAESLQQKAPKLWRQLSKWGKDFDMEHWNFLEKYIEIQKSAKALEKQASEEKKEDKKIIKPNFKYIEDLVAGRPVLSYPLASGGFRLRYGRSRLSGYSAVSLHPATMRVLNNFIGSATHIKLERPSKGAAVTSCDTIEPPIVKLNNGNVIILENESLAKQYSDKIKEVLYLGDILISYGDFINRNHFLIEPGYCVEWWLQEFEKAIVDMFGSIDTSKLQELLEVPENKIEEIIKNPFRVKPSAKLAFDISLKLNIPLYPLYTYHYNQISKNDLLLLISQLKKASVKIENDNNQKIVFNMHDDLKRVLELIGIPHLNVNNEYIVIENDDAFSLLKTLAISNEKFNELKSRIDSYNNNLEIINEFSQVRIRDRSGTFIGARMGRPEKAKMRKLKGTPHGLFPVGQEGGRMRSLIAAVEAGKVRADFPIFYCDLCKRETIFSVCEECEKRTRRMYFCNICGLISEPECKHGKCIKYYKRDIEIKRYFNIFTKKLDMKVLPNIIKGVKGTFSEEHIPEHIVKSILRAKYDLYVNKDGTIRYDCSEIPITHFKPKEISVSVEELKNLGYDFDIKGAPLVSEDQILEIKPHDIIIPCCPVSPDEPCDEILFKTSLFIDELLVKHYNLPPFYNLKTKKDLLGHLVIGLAPHTSAGTVGRIIGFSKTQGFLCHPLFHAAMRRDCDGDESCIFLLMDAFLNFSKKYLPEKRGSTMDAPLVLTSNLSIQEVDDMAFDIDIAWRYPIEFYEAALQHKMPGDVRIKRIANILDIDNPYEGHGFTHDTENFNAGVLCSSYKLLPTMEEKLKAQMELAEKIRAVDENDVARLVIEKHFLRDIKGNLRKFSQQKFRCSKCNESYRRPPLLGACTKCSGDIIFTISEGFITKYLEPSFSLAKKYKIPAYLLQTLELTKRRIEGNFGKEREKQVGLGAWFG